MKLRLGTSGCLLGLPFRFDSGHKRARFLTDDLASFVEWIPVCPEMAAGMGAPRESVRQVRTTDGEIRIVGTRSGTPWTEPLAAVSNAIVERVSKAELDGFVVKGGSPTCGMERVKVYRQSPDAEHAVAGAPDRTGVGVFTERLMAAMPWLPIEEDGRLNDARLREAFLEAVFARARWREFRASAPSRRELIEFHASNKYLLLAHDEHTCRQLGRLVASYQGDDLLDRYEAGFSAAMTTRARVGNHVNVLQHMAGFLRGQVSERARREIGELIDDYRDRLVPLSVPIALMRHHVEEHGIGYLARQTYLNPCPREMRTRLHV